MTSEPVVYVIDDDEAVTDGLRTLFASVRLAVETFHSAEVFLEAISADCSGCILMDVRMPGLSGLDLQVRLSEYGIALPVIVMTGHGDVRMAVRAMKAGAFDFLEKPMSEQDLLDLVRKAIDHHVGTYDTRQKSRQAQRRLKSLTRRESEILALIMKGEPNKRIAYQLGISEKTVEFHRANVMTKMGARSSGDLIRMVATLPGTKGIT